VRKDYRTVPSAAARVNHRPAAMVLYRA